MRIASIFRTWIAMALVLSLCGCGKSDKRAGVAGPGEEEAMTGTTQSRLDDTHQSDESRAAKPEGSDIANDVQAAIAQLPKGGDPLGSITDALEGFDHEVFSEPAAASDWPPADGSGATLFEEIRDAGSLWNNDPELKRAAVGKMSLLTGFIGESEGSFGGLPRLFLEEAKRPQPTKGDVFLLRIVEQAAEQRRVRSEITDQQLTDWNDLAKSSNPVYREIAVILASKLDLSDGQAQKFLSNFDSESDNRVLNQLNRIR